MSEKLEKLREVMKGYAEEDVCLAFSGGVDSSLLLKLACDAARETGNRVYAVTFDTRLHPSCDLENAKKVAGELGGIHRVLRVDELEQERIRMNPPDRCYLCKLHMFRMLRDYAAGLGISTVMEGTNEDDMHVYRPGIRVLGELGIVSPLAGAHVTKAEVKEAAASLGVSASTRPSAPCLATRLPYNTRLDYEVLERIEKGEEYLRALAGGNVRLRLHGEIARLEVDPKTFPAVVSAAGEVAKKLRGLGFSYITLDLEGFRSGSMDTEEILKNARFPGTGEGAERGPLTGVPAPSPPPPR